MSPNLGPPRNPDGFSVQLNSRHIADILHYQLRFWIISTNPILRDSNPVLGGNPWLDRFRFHLWILAICGQTLLSFGHPETICSGQILKSAADSGTFGQIWLVQITEHGQNYFRWHVCQIRSIIGVAQFQNGWVNKLVFHHNFQFCFSLRSKNISLALRGKLIIPLIGTYCNLATFYEGAFVLYTYIFSLNWQFSTYYITCQNQISPRKATTGEWSNIFCRKVSYKNSQPFEGFKSIYQRVIA